MKVHIVSEVEYHVGSPLRGVFSENNLEGAERLAEQVKKEPFVDDVDISSYEVQLSEIEIMQEFSTALKISQMLKVLDLIPDTDDLGFWKIDKGNSKSEILYNTIYGILLELRQEKIDD
jgi:hypothetical protein